MFVKQIKASLGIIHLHFESRGVYNLLCKVIVYMNGTNVVRVNISLPKDLVKEIKKHVPSRGMSKFIAETAKKKIEELEREKALKELLDAPPAFAKIKDSVAYVRKMRRLDEKRMKRLGI